MDSATKKWLCLSGKQEDFATWSTRFIAYIQTKNLFETLAGTAVESVEPAALGDAPTNEQREAHRVATEEFENNKKKFRNDKNTLWCMLALTLDSTSLMLIRHDCVGKDGLSDGTRAWNLLKERFRSEVSPTVVALVSQNTRMRLKPDEALHKYFIRAQELMTRMSNAGERISETIFMAFVLNGLPERFENFVVQDKFSVIPTTEEKYFSFTFSVWVQSYVDKKGKVQNIYQNLRFLDSLRFMPQSLEKLANILPNENFLILTVSLKDIKLQHRLMIDLPKRKGVYPYTYVDSFDKFSECELPPKEFWKNMLEGGEVTISDSDFDHAKLVFQEFDCKNMDYHDLYLITDVLILASIFEEFRKVCYATYGLNCAHFYTASNLSGEAFLKVCKADVELLTSRGHLKMAENLFRGGISSVFAKRKFEANKYLPTFNPKAKQTFGLFIDANSLYGGIMEKFPLA